MNQEFKQSTIKKSNSNSGLDGLINAPFDPRQVKTWNWETINKMVGLNIKCFYKNVEYAGLVTTNNNTIAIGGINLPCTGTSFQRFAFKFISVDGVEGIEEKKDEKRNQTVHHDKKELIKNAFPIQQIQLAAEKFEHDRLSFVKEWVERKDKKVITITELKTNDGKNNRGVFLIDSVNEKLVVKVNKASNTGDFSRLSAAQASYPQQNTIKFPTFAKILAYEMYHGLSMSLFEQAQGHTLKNHYDNWRKNETSFNDITTVFTSVGESMGNFHFSGVEAGLSKEDCKGIKIPYHGDANSSNILISIDDNYKVSLIDNGNVSTKMNVQATYYDVTSMLLTFQETQFKINGNTKRIEKTNEFDPIQLEKDFDEDLDTKIFDQFMRAYLSKVPSGFLTTSLTEFF